MAKRVTLAQIGKKVGVSPMTVSAALSLLSPDSPVRVSPDKARKIRKVAKQMGYQANLLARALRNRRTNTIGVLFRSVHAPSVMSVRIDMLVQRLFADGYRAHLAVAHGNLDDLAAQVTDLLAWQVDGLIIHDLFAEEFDERWKNIEELVSGRRVPLVMCDSDFPISIPCAMVASDHEHGGKIAAEHLLELGHRQLAFVGMRSGPPGRRLKGAMQAVAKVRGAVLSVFEPASTGLSDDPISAVLHASQEGVRTFIEKRGEITGVMCSNDLTAALLTSQLREAGVNVPRDISVVGYDDSEYARTPSPALTTVHHLAAETGRAAAELLLEQLGDSPKPPRKITMTPALVVRQSTAAR